MKLRKIFCMIAIGLIFSVVSNIAYASVNKEGVKLISLTDAVVNALKDNTGLKNLESKINLAQRRYKYAQDLSLDAEKRFGVTYAQHVESKKEELLYPLKRKAELDELIWQKAELEKTLKLDITKIYYQMLLKQQQIELQEKVITSLKNDYAVKEKQMSIGSITKTSLLSFEISIDEAEAQLALYKNELTNLSMDLNKKLGFDVNQALQLKKIQLPEQNFEIRDINEIVSDVLKNAHSVAKLELDKTLKQREYWIVASFGEKVSDADSIEEEILDFNFSIPDEKTAVEYQVRSSYNNILNLADEITIKKLDLDRFEMLLGIAEKKAEIGLITEIDHNKAQIERDTAYVNYNKAKLDYYISVEEIKLYIDPVVLDAQ